MQGLVSQSLGRKSKTNVIGAHTQNYNLSKKTEQTVAFEQVSGPRATNFMSCGKTVHGANCFCSWRQQFIFLMAVWLLAYILVIFLDCILFYYHIICLFVTFRWPRVSRRRSDRFTNGFHHLKDLRPKFPHSKESARCVKFIILL